MTDHDDNIPRPAFLRIFVSASVTGCLVGIVAAAFRLAIERGYAGFIHFAAIVDGYGCPGRLAAPLASAILVTVAVFLTRRFAPEAAGSGLIWEAPSARWSGISPD